MTVQVQVLSPVPNKKERLCLSFLFGWQGLEPIRCNANERCRRRLDGGEQLSLPIPGQRCKSSPVARTRKTPGIHLNTRCFYDSLKSLGFMQFYVISTQGQNSFCVGKKIYALNVKLCRDMIIVSYKLKELYYGTSNNR